MKRKSDPRHQNRIKIVQELFTWQFNNLSKVSPQTKKIISELDKIDPIITKCAPSRPIRQINKIDLSILRLSVFELIIEKDAPFKVIIDEAIELGKEFGSDSSSNFINGVLGQLMKTK